MIKNLVILSLLNGLLKENHSLVQPINLSSKSKTQAKSNNLIHIDIRKNGLRVDQNYPGNSNLLEFGGSTSAQIDL